jgi:ketosteroid isomerase-like protein
VDTESAVRAWIDGWTRGWPAKDADAVAELYSDGAAFVSHPFREPHLGPAGVRAYAEWAFADEDDEPADVRFGKPVVEGDRAAVEYWAIVRLAGAEQTIAGIAVLRFDADGRVASQREYWAMDEGRREPPAGWGGG